MCHKCLRDTPTKGAILSGKFGDYCAKCLGEQSRQASGQKATSERNQQREDYKKDMLQPWLPNGKPNTEFIRAYPERSDNFTEAELKEYG